MNKIDLLEQSLMKTDLPPFFPGDTINVHVRVKEGDKERIQEFQGIVIAIRGEGLKKSFTIRKISDGVGVERIFPVHSPSIAKIVKVRTGNVRRAKLFYLRTLAAKQVRAKTK
ncbi:MAG: 50S ribosomal protein L19 [Ignavibacteria bacterium]|nr:50S ribosomal protein L19 [Ignavibacteria bacterium]